MCPSSWTFMTVTASSSVGSFRDANTSRARAGNRIERAHGDLGRTGGPGRGRLHPRRRPRDRSADIVTGQVAWLPCSLARTERLHATLPRRVGDGDAGVLQLRVARLGV